MSSSSLCATFRIDSDRDTFVGMEFMDTLTPNHLTRLTVKYHRAFEATIRTRTVLRTLVKTKAIYAPAGVSFPVYLLGMPNMEPKRRLEDMNAVAGVSFPYLFFRHVLVLYFTVLGLVPCPLGIFWVLLGPRPLTADFTTTIKGTTSVRHL